MWKIGDGSELGRFEYLLPILSGCVDGKDWVSHPLDFKFKILKSELVFGIVIKGTTLFLLHQTHSIASHLTRPIRKREVAVRRSCSHEILSGDSSCSSTSDLVILQ